MRAASVVPIPAAVAVAVALAGACGDDGGLIEDDGGLGIDAGPEPRVSDFASSEDCSTEVVRGLSLQIADEIACAQPDALVVLGEGDGIVFTSAAVLPYMSKAGRADLVAAVANAGGRELRINSGFRTVVQQHLLYTWWTMGRCGISVAAEPGTSNHESGRAVDVDNYGDWLDELSYYHWEQDVAGDPVHFDHTLSPDNRGLDVQAFQRLWNRNHPDELLDEDGAYGPLTAQRIGESPANGFPIGPTCGARLSPSAPDPQLHEGDARDAARACAR